jgi:hypothetical protein
MNKQFEIKLLMGIVIFFLHISVEILAFLQDKRPICDGRFWRGGGETNGNMQTCTVYNIPLTK